MLYLTAYSVYAKILSMARRIDVLGPTQVETLQNVVVDQATKEYGHIRKAIGSANMMKTIGTIGAFAGWAIFAGATAAMPFVTAPTALALHALSSSSEAVGKVSALLAGTGVIKGMKNNRELSVKKMATRFGFELAA